MANIAKPTGKGTKGKPAAETTDNLESEELVGLNFKVPASFRRELRTFASQQDMTMREVVERAFYEYRDAN